MTSTSLRSELTWFFGGTVTALFCCLLLGLPIAVISIFMAGYVLWLLYRMQSMVKWLSSGAKTQNAPQSCGLTDDMVELIHREKKYSRKQKNRYRSTLAQFNSLAADLPDATIVLNSDFDIRWANSASLKLLNIHSEKDRGQRIDNLIRDPEFHSFLNNISASEEVEINSPIEDGRILAIRKVPTENKLTVLIAADITQRVQVREMRKAFVADVSHELRTPLTVIRGYLEMLQDSDHVAADSQDALKQVIAQSDRMRGIVEDLLELSKLEANPLGEKEGESINVGAIIHSIMNPLQKNASEHVFTLEVDDSIALLGSEREIYSVCNNLLTNAVKYTDAGSNIRISWQLQPDGTALYQVADDGPGIESRHISRLSERFYRVDASRSRDLGGTGLGLAIVKHAVQRHGGELEISSTPGRGSVFGARFPITRVLTLAKAVNQ